VKSGPGDNGDGLLAVMFLLAWCDVGFSNHTSSFIYSTGTSQIHYDEHEAIQAAFLIEVAESVITGDKDWNSASKCLLQWLNSLDAKGSHLGGRQILSPKILEVSLQHRVGTHQVERHGEGTNSCQRKS
jgi:hypothetical protein